jgi:hypothetical protein
MMQADRDRDEEWPPGTVKIEGEKDNVQPLDQFGEGNQKSGMEMH